MTQRCSFLPQIIEETGEIESASGCDVKGQSHLADGMQATSTRKRRFRLCSHERAESNLSGNHKWDWTENMTKVRGITWIAETFSSTVPGFSEEPGRL